MEVTVNREKITDFLVDSEGEIRTPMYFDLNNDLSDTAKELFKVIAAYSLQNSTANIQPRDFKNLVDQYCDITKRTMLAIVELKQNNYIDIT